MYKKEIVTEEFVYSEQEQQRLRDIRATLRHLLKQDIFSTEEFMKLLDEMKDILEGVWSPPMPF